MAKQKRSTSLSLANRVLKEYRKSHHLTQEQIANDLHIEPRTYRAYENGEYPINNIHELRRIADILGIEPERLGLTSLYVPRTPEQIKELIKRVWFLIRESRLQEAHMLTVRLLSDLQDNIVSEDIELLQALAQAQHVAGHITSITSNSKESYRAIPYYREMESIARTIGDQTLLNISLTYQGDMYRRMGNLEKAVVYLEAANETTPQADAAARGNAIQLLGRTYLRKHDIYGFEHALGQSAEIAQNLLTQEGSTQGHYSLGTVYEEYGRSYAELGQMQKGLDYLNLAETTLPPTKLWKLLIKTARALALVKGNEIRSGVELAVEAALESRETSNLRYLDRIFVIDKYLDDLLQLRRPLREALYGVGDVDI